MTHLYREVNPSSKYFLLRGQIEENNALENSFTLYVGNLSFLTTEEQIWELFSKAGEVRRVIMGLNKRTLEPCGFCFVECFTHESAADCMYYINGTILDDCAIRVDWDPGFTEGRQYGKGASGGQVRDEYRNYDDPARRSNYYHKNDYNDNRDYRRKRKYDDHYDNYNRKVEYPKKLKSSELENTPFNDQDYYVDEFNRVVPKKRL